MEGKKRHSLSRSLQNLFHKKNTYSLKPEKSKSGNKFYESINDSNDVQLDPVPSGRTGKARVWSVRNSKSPIDPLTDNRPEKCGHEYKTEPTRKGQSNQHGHRFDVLSFFGISKGNHQLEKHNDCETYTQIQVTGPTLDTSNEDNTTNSEDPSDRSRLSSFGSSNCYSESCGSHGNSSLGLREHQDSDLNRLDPDISTSYWDLQLPESPSLRSLNKVCRRNSDTAYAERKPRRGSSDSSDALMRRRLSDGPGAHYPSWQDKVLHSVRNTSIKSTLYLGEQDPDDEAGSDECSELCDTHDFQLPRLACRKSASMKRSRSVSECGDHGIQVSVKSCGRSLQRSRSADFKQAVQRSKGKKERLSECQLGFSDIESSEESESTQEPKESSAESHAVSSADTSSSYSCNSGNELVVDKEEVIDDKEIDRTSNHSPTRDVDKPVKERDSKVEEMVPKPKEYTQTEDLKVDKAHHLPTEINKEIDIALQELEDALKSEGSDDEHGDLKGSKDMWLIQFSDEGDDIGTDVDIGYKMPTILVEDIDKAEVENCERTQADSLDSSLKDNGKPESIVATGPTDNMIVKDNIRPIEEVTQTEHNGECKDCTEELISNYTNSLKATKQDDNTETCELVTKPACLVTYKDKKVSSEEDTNDKTGKPTGKNSILQDDDILLTMLTSCETPEKGMNNDSTEDSQKEDDTAAKIEANIERVIEMSENTNKGNNNAPGNDVEWKTECMETKDVGIGANTSATGCNGYENKSALHVEMETVDQASDALSDDSSETQDTHFGETVEKLNSGRSPANKVNAVIARDKCIGEDNEQLNESLETYKSNKHLGKVGSRLEKAGSNGVAIQDARFVDTGLNAGLDNDSIEFESGERCTIGLNIDPRELQMSETSFVGHGRLHESSTELDEDEMTELNRCDEFVQVDFDDIGHDVEFQSVSMEDLLFCSGVTSDEDGIDDVEKVFEAINKEAAKYQHQDKDMMVMFLVGGELKVLRRSGSNVHSHADLRHDLPSMTRKDYPQHNGNHDYIFSHSVHDVNNRGRPKSAIIVTRSQSFNGMANPHMVSGLRKDGVPPAVVLGESFRHHRNPATMPPPRAQPGTRASAGFSFRKSPKVPKIPRPNRALLMFQSVKKGIREFIEATNDDILQLQQRETDGTSTAQGKLHEADKQIKSAERYLKRLEFHLAKLDELHEYYMLQQQLREGVRTMHRAYVTSPGNQRNQLSNVKYGYKECTQTMCNIEAQLESMMGTFNCKLKGMAGFARLCPGDVFEVTVRHGTQKWKTKGRIEKSGNQKWDIPEFNFKAVVGDIINIKGLEVRAFKSVLLGQKSCETKDLFSANPQLMTVSINVNGSLKLSIVITWNPLDGVDEQMAFVEPQMRAQSTPRRRPVSVIALNGQYQDEVVTAPDRRLSAPITVIQQTKDDNFILRTNAMAPQHANNHVSSYHGLDSPHVSARLNEHLPDAYKHSGHAVGQVGPLYSQTAGHGPVGFHSSPALSGGGDSNFSSANHGHVVLPSSANQKSAFVNMMPPVLHFPSMTSGHTSSSDTREDEEHSVLNIEDVLHNLSSTLEDYHGQYTELQKLEDLVKWAQKLIRKQFRSSSRSSSISVSIESALEAFDFLECEDGPEDPQSPSDKVVSKALATFDFLNKEESTETTETTSSHNAVNTTKASFDDMLCSPESTAKTGDSGIESLAQRLSEDTQLGSSLGSSPVPPSTGNEEVDQCLMYHFTYCDRLLENLGAFGPLKCREIYALDKIQKQCRVIENLLKLAKAGAQIDLHAVMSSVCEDKTLREFWVKCTDQNVLYIHPDRLLASLEQQFASVITEKYNIDHVKVCEHLMTRIMDIPDYAGEKSRPWFVLTMHQFVLYFKEEGGLKHVEDIAREMKLVERLLTGNPDIVIKAILTLRDTLPSTPCLKVIGMLLATQNKEVEQCTISYLNLIQKKKPTRDKAMITFIEGMEDKTAEIRSGSCTALAILEATESIDQLVYLWQSDSSSSVQKAAKEAILTLGEEGRKALEDAQLSKHGFQGIQVHK